MVGVTAAGGEAARFVRLAASRAVAAPAVVGVAIGCAALVRMGAGVDLGSTADADLLFWAIELAAALTAAVIGGWLVLQGPSSAAGWLLQAASVALAVSAATATTALRPGTLLPFGAATVTVHLWANVLGRVILLTAAVVCVPDRLVPGRVGGGLGTALVAVAVVAGTAGLLLHDRAGELAATDFGFGNSAWIDAAASVPSWVFVVLLAVHVTALSFLSRRRGDVDPSVFQVIGWSLAAGALPVAFPALADRLPAPSSEVLAAITLPTLPVVSVVAILRALSWTVNRMVSRTIVWGVLSMGIVVVQAVAVAVAAHAGGEAGFVTAVAASVAVAAGFHAARTRLQRAVDRVLYGVQRDPWVALNDLGGRLAVAVGPDDVLPDLADAIAAAFGAGVVVELVTATGQREVARAGRFEVGETSASWPLMHQGEQVGTLVVSPPPDAPFRAADLAALGNLAQQAAVAAHGVRTSMELRRSQARLVSAVEEERRRLQRELHDGLGPTLAGVALGIRAASNRSDAADGDGLLVRLGEEVEASVDEVRRIVHDLRPPVLDQLGLTAAVRAYAERCSSEELLITVEVDGRLPVLSAATEVAAYRIAVEAITNVVRHAGARRCRVVLRGGDGIVVEVEDDGVGLGEVVTAGVGLASMRERATSTGGRLQVGAAADGAGTRVVASLPAEVVGA